MSIFTDVTPQIILKESAPVPKANSSSIFQNLTSSMDQRLEVEEKESINEKASNLNIPKSNNSKKIMLENDDYGECYPEMELPTLEDLKKEREAKGMSIKEAGEQSYLDKARYLKRKEKFRKKGKGDELDKIRKVNIKKIFFLFI